MQKVLQYLDDNMFVMYRDVNRVKKNLVPVIVEQASDRHVIPGSRAPSTSPWAAGRRHRHGQYIWHALRNRGSANVVLGHGAAVLGWLALGWRDVGLVRGRLENGVVHDATIRRGIRRRRTNSIGAVAPDLLELGRRDVGTVVGSNSSPELLAASLVDGAKAVSINNLWLVSNLGVNTETIERLRRAARGKSARLGEEDLVLRTAGRVGYRASTDMRAARVAHGGAVTRRLRVDILLGDHAIGGRSAGGAARSGGGYRAVALAAVAAVGELVVVQAAGKLSLLEVCSNMLVRHLLHAGLEEVVFLFFRPGPVSTGRHLASTKAGIGGRLRVHLGQRREDLGLVVKHFGDGAV
jgi:hypothetical protein